jgi:CBS domain-containing protein
MATMSVTVGEIMVREVIFAAPGDRVEEVRRQMLDREIHAMPVVDDTGRPIGILTTTDLLEDAASGTRVEETMTPRVQTVTADTDVRIAARIMRNHRLHHLLVTRDGDLTGILSAFDLLKLIEER